jgi:dipeptidyl aminopeptidase/acylaminoacyl peptidase
MMHPVKKVIEAVASNYEKTEWTVLDESIKADLDYLKTLENAEVNITDRTLDDKLWTVAFTVDNGPVKYYLYDRSNKKATFMFTNRKALEGLQLSFINPVVIKSRDNLNLVSYLTLPLWADPDNDARPEKPLPMVLLVHGGPWGRDRWGYNSLHQWLANRGYAVLSVNFRGSTGLGKDFINAGNKEWAGKMHDDLIDAVNWAVEENIADKEKVAIMGGSYGGYATLVGLTFTPDVFACGVDIVGPSNLNTLLETIPPYWAPMIEMFATRMGDNRTEEGKKFLESISPLFKIDKINKPLLIGQGANDPRVKQTESDQIVKAMQDKNIPVTYVLFPDEGHGFARPENNLSFFAVTDLFLAKHLGGRSEPIGEDFKGSSVTVPNGAEQIKSLTEALNTIK